jgi:hypothetical protein
MFNPNHKTVKLPFHDRLIDIDEKLSELIRMTWEAGITTVTCCQEWHPGKAFIEFESTKDIVHFLNILDQNYKPHFRFGYDEPGAGLWAQLFVSLPTHELEGITERFAMRMEVLANCIVERCILDEESKVGYIHRELPNRKLEQGNRYYDSGWRVWSSSTSRGATAYTTIYDVLKIDNSWEHLLLGSPVGSIFERKDGKWPVKL